VLDLPRGSDARAIRQRYRELVAREHPDKRPDLADADARFAEITAAYRELMELLSDGLSCFRLEFCDVWLFMILVDDPHD
jgi:curved DNA-binding protein CbpA